MLLYVLLSYEFLVKDILYINALESCMLWQIVSIAMNWIWYDIGEVSHGYGYDSNLEMDKGLEFVDLWHYELSIEFMCTMYSE